jgi:hypothetical protein
VAEGFPQEPAREGEVPQRPGQPVRDRVRAGRAARQGGPQVVSGYVEFVAPLPADPLFQLRRVRGEPRPMPFPRAGLLTAGSKPVRGERAHGIQQPPPARRGA